MSYILRNCSMDYYERNAEIFRSVNKLTEEELQAICTEYVKYYWLECDADRVGFQILDFEMRGRVCKLTYSTNFEEEEEVLFIYDEMPDNVGWLVNLKKGNE